MDHDNDVTFGHMVDLGAYHDYASDCDCPGPPPPPFPDGFPPPPPAPSTQFCDDNKMVSDLHVCEVGYLESKYENPGIPSFAIIIVCAVLLILMLTVIIFLIWRHKRKAENLVQCKNHHNQQQQQQQQQQSKNVHCDISSPHNNVPTYEDALINHHVARLPPNSRSIHRRDTQTLAPMELLDVKCPSQFGRGPPQLPDRNNRIMYQQAYTGFVMNQNTSCSSTDSMRSHGSQEQFNPVYEEVSGASNSKQGGVGGGGVQSDSDDTDIDRNSVVASEDEFAEDELSLADFPKDANEDPYVRNSKRPSVVGTPCSTGENPYREFNDHVQQPRSNGTSGRNKKNHSRSIDRNINKYPSDSLRAKHKYYVSKDKMTPDLYGSGYNSRNGRKGSTGNSVSQYPSKNNVNGQSQPRNYDNRNSSGSGGSAVNSHSTGTPPHCDSNRFNDSRQAQCHPPNGIPPYYTGSRTGLRNNVDAVPIDHRQSSLPYHHQQHPLSDVHYNDCRPFGDLMQNQNIGHRPPPTAMFDQFAPTRHSTTSSPHSRKQRTPTEPQDHPYNKKNHFGPVNNFNVGYNDPNCPFTIDGSSQHGIPAVTSHQGDKNVEQSTPGLPNTSGHGHSNNIKHQDEPIYNELDPVYAQRPPAFT